MDAIRDRRHELNTNAIGLDRDGTMFGGLVGLGADVALGDSAFVRADYEFSYFGKETFEYCGGCVLENKVQAHDFILGVGMRF